MTGVARPGGRLDPADVRRTLRAANLRPRHGLSQNFLTDVAVIETILAEAAPRPGDRILEIGPGLGILTRALLDAGAAVTAVELDAGLVGWLREAFAGQMESVALARTAADPAKGSLALVEGDILDQDLASLVTPPFAVVANLPYHITSPTLHRLLGLRPPPTRLVLMLQREVAERIAARPGDMSYLSVFVQYHAAVRLAFNVPRAAFEPPPKVDSAVVVIEPVQRAKEGPDEAEEDELWRLVQAAFRERRKMLHNVLARQLSLEPARVETALEAAGIEGDRRPQTLSVDEWLRLKAALGPIEPDRRGRSGAATRPAHGDRDRR